MPRTCSTRSGTFIASANAPTAAICSISTAMCCTNCMPTTPSHNWHKQQRPVRRPDLTFAVQDHTVATKPGRNDDTNPSGDCLPQGDARGLPQERHQAVRYRRSGAGHFPRRGAGTRHRAAGRNACGSRQSRQYGRRRRCAGLRLSAPASSTHILATQVMAIKRPEAHAGAARRQARAARQRQGCGAADHRRTRRRGRARLCVEYAGAAVRAMPIEQRMTLCNLNIEMGGRSGFVAPDDATFAWLAGRPYVPQGAMWDRALEYWRTLATRRDASFDREVDARLHGARTADHLGHRSEPGRRHFRSRARTRRRSSQAGAPRRKARLPIWISRPERRSPACRSIGFLSALAPTAGCRICKSPPPWCAGGRVADGVVAMVVPGSSSVKREAEAAGLDRVFRDAGFLLGRSGLLDVRRRQRRPRPAGRALRLDHQSQFRESAGREGAHASREPGDRRGHRDRRPDRRCPATCCGGGVMQPFIRHTAIAAPLLHRRHQYRSDRADIADARPQGRLQGDAVLPRPPAR